MNCLDAHYKAIKRNTCYTGRINGAIDKLKNYRDDEKIEYEKIAGRMMQQGQLNIFPDKEIISRKVEHNERMRISENGISISEQSVKNLEIDSLCVLIVYGINRFNKQSEEQMQHVRETFLEQYKERDALIFPEEPKIINDLIERGVINPENVSYIDFEREEGLELVKIGSNIDSKEGILEFIKNVGKEAGFTKFVIKSSIFVRFPWLMRFFKMDESEVALSVPMEELRSGEAKILRHILEIPEGFVNEIYKIYQKWPFLAVAMVDAMVCHEKAHRNSKITGLDDKSKAAAEVEASEYLLNEQGLWGVALFVWYFTYYLNTRATVSDCIKWFGFVLDRKQFEQIDEIVKQIDDSYSAKGGERAKRYRRKAPSRPAQIKFEDGTGLTIGLFVQPDQEGVTFIPEKIKEVSEKEKPVIMKKYIEQLIIFFNTVYSKSSFDRFSIGDCKEMKLLAAQISRDFDYKGTQLVEYIESWGGDELIDARSVASLKEFLKGFSPYLTKYGYYFNMDITQSYPKPIFIGRIKDKKEASMVDSAGKKQTVNITYLERIKAHDSSYLERINDDYFFWKKESPICLLPVTEEIIIIEDRLLAEAKECAKRLMFESERGETRSAFVFKQWGEMVGLPEEEIIEKIKNDLRQSYTIGAIRDAFNRFFLKIYEKYPEENRDDLSELSRRLAMLSLGPLPHYFTNSPSILIYSNPLNEICAFMLEKMEGLNTPGKVVVGEDIYKEVPLLVSYDEADIRILAEVMYEGQFNHELAVGSLEEIKAMILLDNLNVEGMIKGRIAMDDLTFKALKENFIETGKIGNDDKDGWDVVVKTLALKEIKPEDLVIKKVEEIISTEEQWEGLVKLYPYLQMMKYKEVKNGKYLNVHWCALKRVIIFDRYEKELDINQFRKEQNYIENKIKEYSDLLENVRELFKANEHEMRNLLNREESEIPMLIGDYERTIEGLEEEIYLIEKEINELKNKETAALSKKTMIFFGPSNEQKEEIKNKTNIKVEEREEKIKQNLADIEDFKNKKELLEEEISVISVKESKIREEFKEQEKQITKCNEILGGLEW